MNTTEKPWIELSEICEQYGITFRAAKFKVDNGSFPVPTYRVGKKIVVDREVHKRFFELKREAGLLALKNNYQLIK